MKAEPEERGHVRPVELTNAGGDDGEPVYHEFSAQKQNLYVKVGEAGKPPASKQRKVTAHFGNEPAWQPTAPRSSKTLEPAASSASTSNMKPTLARQKDPLQLPENTNSLQLNTTKDDNCTNTLSANTSERNESRGRLDDMFEKANRTGQQSKFRANLNERLRNGGDSYTTYDKDDDKKKGETKY